MRALPISAPVNTATWSGVPRAAGGSGSLHGTAIPVMTGDLAGELNRFANGFATAQNQRYVSPSSSELDAVRSAWRAVGAGDSMRAAALLQGIGCELVTFVDAPSGARYNVMRERFDPGSPQYRGWGIFIHNPAARVDASIEIPHARSDGLTQLLGADALRVSGAAAMLVSGALRDAAPSSRGPGGSDMAHASGSVFDAIHRAQLTPGHTVVQIHGFDEAKHPTYGQVVVSEGAIPTGRAERLAGALRDAGYIANYYDGTHFRLLAGTRNLQGSSTRAAGAQFLHIEVGRSLRFDDAIRSRFGRLLGEVIAAASHARPRREPQAAATGP